MIPLPTLSRLLVHLLAYTSAPVHSYESSFRSTLAKHIATLLLPFLLFRRSIDPPQTSDSTKIQEKGNGPSLQPTFRTPCGPAINANRSSAKLPTRHLVPPRADRLPRTGSQVVPERVPVYCAIDYRQPRSVSRSLSPVNHVRAPRLYAVQGLLLFTFPSYRPSPTTMSP